MKSIAIAALTATAVLLAGCGDSKGDAKKQAGPPATLVTVTKVQARTLELTEDTVGSVENFMDPRVGAEVAGRAQCADPRGQ